FIIRRFDNVMPRKNALPQAKSSMVTGSLGITQSSGLDRHAVFARQRVDEFRNDDIASTQSARQAKDATDLVVEPDRQYAQLIRRLTPWECELLQGFPLDWTDIPSASDSARYRALGNSIPVPCVEFIMKSLQAVAAMEVDDERSQAQGDHHAEE
ncbi:MAG: DNA cytosine methyltransferase, partial [Oscillospiraceae bacterium]